MAQQDEFTDVQPVQQAKQPGQDEFTDVQPVSKAAPSTAKHPDGWRPPIVTKPEEPGMLDKADQAVTDTLAPKSTDYDSWMHTETRAVPKTLGREVHEGVKSALGMIPGVYHAFADEATPEEKAKYADFEKQNNEAPGKETSGLKRIGLGLGRLTGGEEASNAVQDYASGKVTPEAALSVAPEAVGGAAGQVAAGESINIGAKNPLVRKAVAAPIRLAARGLEKAAPVLPHAIGAGLGMAAATEAGIPHPYVVGGATGALAGKILPPESLVNLAEKGKVLGLSPEEAAYSKLEDRAKSSEKELDKAQKEIDAYGASKEQGVEAPEDVQKKYEKAKTKATEDRFHADAAKEKLNKATTPDKPIEGPGYTDGFQRDIDSMAPKNVKAPAEPVAPKRAINVKLPGEVQPEVIEQPLREKPQVNEGATVPLAKDEGLRVGKPKLLADVNPEPEAPKQEILPPEKPAKVGKPERGNLRSLHVDEAGNVQDKEATPEGRVESLLREGMKSEPEAKKPLGRINVEEPKEDARLETKAPVHKENVEYPAEPFGQEEKPTTGHVNSKGELVDRAEDKPPGEPSSPRTEWKKGDEGSWQEVVKDEHAHGIRDRAPEATDAEPAVHEQVANLSDENLKRLAKAHGLDPDKYDFKARDEGRHRVERDQLAKDVVHEMGDDEVQNIARNAQKLDNPDTASFAKADRAAKVFPRLRGPVDEFGNPTVAGGSTAAEPATGYSQKADKRYPATNDAEAKRLNEHINKTSSKDTDFVHQAMKDLGPDAKLSDVMDRAQKLKAEGTAVKPEVEGRKLNPEAKNSSGEDMTHTLKMEGGNKVQEVVTRNADGKKIGELVAHETKPGEYTVRSNQVYDDAMKGKGRGTDQLRHLLSNQLEDVKTLKSDISTSEGARGVWDKMMKQYSDAVTKHEYKDGQVQYSVDMDKYREPVDVAKGAEDYNSSEKLPKIEPEKVDRDARAAEIADDYAKMKHEPNDPYVKKSYKALVDDVKKQYDYATKKMGIQIVPTDVDPYKSYEEMRDDVKNNKTMKVWRGGNPLPEDHALAQIDPKTGESYNTMFRAVHDIFGHVAQDHDFSEPGEESAWNVHRQMMNPDAVPAMTTETRGQTSWFYNNEGVRGGEPLGKFADQKAGLLPEYANERTPEAGKTLDHIKADKPFAVLTAENPSNTRISDAENAARNRKLMAELREKGYKPVPVEGHTKDVEGNTEHSFFVPDISPADAAEIGKTHGQAAILTKQGLHDLVKNTVNPSDNAKVMTGEEARKQPYYSKVGDQDFSVPIDFDKEEPFEKRAGEDRRSEEVPVDEERRVGARRNAAGVRVDENGDPEMSPDVQKLWQSSAFGEKPSEDIGTKVREKNPEPTREEVAAASGASEAEAKSGPEATSQTARMSDEELKKLGFTAEDIAEGKHLPTVSGGSGAGTAPAKSNRIPKLAEENLREEEKAGVTKSQAGRKAFVDNLMALPSVKETVDIAKAGEGGKEWYQRSTKAFGHLMDEAPRYFKEEDRNPFINFLASLSPQQSVAMNLREALHTWTQYVDEGRPTGKGLEKLLRDNLTLPNAKIPNAVKAIAGEQMWPDLSKNSNFKVPSFGDNLNGDLDRGTHDGWMALFNGLDAKNMSRANVYHAVSAVTRAAAKELGWKHAEAQAAIWAFTKVFTEKGETEPAVIRKYSEDFADIMAHDPESRKLIQNLGVDLGKLDAKLKGIGAKPKITPGASPSTERSIGKLATRIETARGKGTIPPPKSGYLGFGDEPDEETNFRPEDFETVGNKLKRKKK